MASKTNSQSQNSSQFTAKYTSPTNQPFTLTKPLTTPTSNSLKEKTHYLQDLRKATAALQNEINEHLTQRMEEDKARDTIAGGKSRSGKQGADDAKEEENYGEEVGEDDD